MLKNSILALKKNTHWFDHVIIIQHQSFKKRPIKKIICEKFNISLLKKTYKKIKIINKKKFEICLEKKTLKRPI
jgi:hypothetical protein